MELVIDAREAKLIQELKKDNVSHVTEALVVGDVLLRELATQSIRFIIERKTISDLIGSVRSGRFAEQRERLLLSGCRIAYVIEQYPSLSTFSIEDQRLVRGAIENLVALHGISFLPTDNVNDTKCLLVRLADKFSKEATTAKCTRPVFVKRKERIVGDIFTQQLLLIPGVSPRNVSVITNLFPATSTLCEAIRTDAAGTKRRLAEIKVSNRRLGEVLAARIIDVYKEVVVEA